MELVWPPELSPDFTAQAGGPTCVANMSGWPPTKIDKTPDSHASSDWKLKVLKLALDVCCV